MVGVEPDSIISLKVDGRLKRAFLHFWKVEEESLKMGEI